MIPATGLHDLLTLVRARVPLIVVETREEQRIAELAQAAAGELRLPLFRWTVTEGLHRQEPGYAPQRHNSAPLEMLAHIKASHQSGLYLLIDLHPYLAEPRVVRLLKEITQQAEARRQILILLGYRLELPAEVAHLGARFQLTPPDPATLARLVDEVVRDWQQASGQPPARIEPEARQALIRNLAGLSADDARRLARRAIVDDGALTAEDLPGLARRKYELLNQGGVLTYEPDTARFADLGGLASLKEWLCKRQSAFAGTARPGLPAPKGILLIGVQGCGKSLAAKAVAGTWQVPLLRLDLGAAYNKYHGETERNLRESLQLAEAMAPCVLWLDEIEKGVAGDDGDSGTSRRVLATLLTWMAEKTARVFLVATANDIAALPPELVRKGRLDEIFFVDLPDHAARREIFEIHLRRRELDPAAFDLELLAEHANGFSGAEIEQAVVAGLYAVTGGAGQLDQALLLRELGRTHPLSVVMQERVTALRNWARGRTVPAQATEDHRAGGTPRRE